VLELGIGAGALEVVCLGAHPDDIEIGCGGTLLRLASRPQTSVAALVLTGTPDRVRESEQALEGLFPGTRLSCVGLPDGRLPEHWGAVKQALEDLAAIHSPHVVLAPRADDAHQDHVQHPLHQGEEIRPELCKERVEGPERQVQDGARDHQPRQTT